MPAVGSEVVYQIVTDRFSRGGALLRPPPAADSGRHAGGDWPGITARLRDGYFNDLGVTHLWISPVVQNVEAELTGPWGVTSGYHGYWARDFARHNPRFGTDRDLRDLLSAADDAGIGIVADFALNHTSPADADAGFMEAGALYDDGRLLATLHDDPDGLFHHYGDFCGQEPEERVFKSLFNLADLDQHNPVVDEVLKTRLDGWLRRGVAGVRLDAVRHMSAGWVHSLLSRLDWSRRRLVFAEWFVDGPHDDAEFAAFARLTRCALQDFHVAAGIRQTLRDGKSWDTFTGLLDRADQMHPQPARVVTFFDNHDMDRFLVTPDDDRALLHLALVLLFTTRGRPCVYYGSEQYLHGAGDEGNPGTRQVMPGFDRDTPAFRLIAGLSGLRRDLPQLRFGPTNHLHADDDLYVFRRGDAEDAVVVAVNKGTAPRHVEVTDACAVPGRWNDLLRGHASASCEQAGVLNLRVPARAAGVFHVGARLRARIGLVEPPFATPGSTVRIAGNALSGKRIRLGDGRPAPIVEHTAHELAIRVPQSLPHGPTDVMLVDGDDGVVDTVRAAFTRVDGPLAPVRIVVKGTPADVDRVFLEVADGDHTVVHGPMYDTFVHPRPDRYFDVALAPGHAARCRFIGYPPGDGAVVWSAWATVVPDGSRPQTVTLTWNNQR